MPTFSQQYVPPGAYVKFTKEQLSPALSALFRIPCLIGTGKTTKNFTKSLVKTAELTEEIGLENVSSITRIGETEISSEYVRGVDFSLVEDSIVWGVAGQTSDGVREENNLDFGTFLSLFTISDGEDDLVTDSYVLELTVKGTGSTRSILTGVGTVAAETTQTGNLTISIAGEDYVAAITSGDTRAEALVIINDAIEGFGTATLNGENKLVITAYESGSTQTITVTGTTALKHDFGLSDGNADTFAVVLGINGTGKYTITPRSTRISTTYTPALTPNTAIPGVSLLILNTSSGTVGHRFEILTTAPAVIKNPPVGSTFWVTGVQDKAEADYDLKIYTQEEEAVVYNDYGDPSPSNSISLGAYVAFRNGAEIIGVVQTLGGSGTSHFQAAIDKLEDEAVYYILPLTDNPLVQSYAKLHCNTQSSITNRRERVLITSGPTTASLFDHQDIAVSLNDERVRYIAPSSWSLTYQDTSNIEYTVTVIGAYAAVALAAQRSINDVALPSTRKQIAGLLPTNKFNNSQMNLLASKGVCVFERNGGIVRVRHDLTSFQGASIESKEGSIVEIKDYVTQILRNTLEEEFPGSKILRATPRLVEQICNSALEGLVQQEVITAFENVKASQNTVDPTQMDIKTGVASVYPFNYALVEFSFIRRTITT